MAVEWFTRLMGDELGPLTPSQLVEMARKHQITPDDLIRKGRDGQWVPAQRVNGLFEAASKPAPEPPPSPAKAPSTTAKSVKRKPPANRPPSKRLWYFISNGTKHGPMPFTSLKEKARAGQIKQTDRVWSNTCPKWSIAADVEGLDVK